MLGETQIIRSKRRMKIARATKCSYIGSFSAVAEEESGGGGGGRKKTNKQINKIITMRIGHSKDREFLAREQTTSETQSSCSHCENESEGVSE